MKQNKNLRVEIKLINEFQQRYKRETNGKLLEASRNKKKDSASNEIRTEI